MAKPVCSGCGGTIENPKSVVYLPDSVVLCLSCFESERDSTPQFGVDFEDEEPYYQGED